MTGWLIYSEKDISKNNRYIEFYIEEGKLQNIDITLILVENLQFGIKNDTWFLTYQDQSVDYPDFAICRTIYPLLNKQLEYMRIKVFNNSHVADICNDKAKTYQYVAQLGIRMLDSQFYLHDLSVRVMDRIAMPTVVKAVDGHGGSQVFLVNSFGTTDADRIKNEVLDKLNHSDTVFQPLTGNRHQDLRVYVIGKKIVAAILRTAREGFKSNFSLGGTVEKYELSENETHIINKIIGIFEFGLVGIDFIIGDDGELIFNEIEDVVGARMLYQCTDINLVRLYLEHIKASIVKN